MPKGQPALEKREVAGVQASNVVRKRIVFHGSVQGVGFRYRAQHAADLHGCTGWVKNEWDGTVSMEIQGDPMLIDAVISAIEQGRYVRIEHMECSPMPVVEGECGFRVR